MGEQEQRDGVLQLVVLQLGNEYYGADISLVREVGPLQRVTRVPRTPSYVEGVTNLRGRVIPVMDLRRKLGLPVGANTKATRIAVAELEGGQVGMVVDSVLEVLRVKESSVEPPSPMLSGIDRELVTGVVNEGGRLIILLDLVKVLEREERKVV